MIKKPLKSVLCFGIAVILAIMLLQPVFADYNGIGGIGARPGGSVKAWYNYGEDEGYMVQLYCCRVLGSAGRNGSNFINDSPLVEVDLNDKDVKEKMIYFKCVETASLKISRSLRDKCGQR